VTAGTTRSDHRSGGPDLLDGIDLVVFDKDGTLIDFDAMWAPWATHLATELELRLGRPLAAELYAALDFDAAAGRTLPGGVLAVTPMTELFEWLVGFLVGLGAEPAKARGTLEASWSVPDPVALAHPVAPLRPLFEALRESGRRIAVATSDDHDPTVRTLEALGVADLVDAVIGADDGVAIKPAAAMLEAVCDRLGVPAARTAIVGDARPDLAMGRAAGAGLVVAVLSGLAGRAELEPLADVVVGSIGDLVSARD